MQKEKLEEKIKNFNPDENGLHDHGIFGLPFKEEESRMILVPVPWEATVSYKEGAALGPKTILDSSQQIDLYDPINPNAWKEGIVMQDIPADIFYKNKQVREKVLKYLDGYVSGKINKNLLEEINRDCASINEYVKEITARLLKDDKIVGIVGGDHSVPLGYLESLGEKYKDFGILHIDAHSDLRESYEGFEFSHASIMNNALKIKNISKIIQVGIRDMSERENELINKEKGKIVLYTDYEIRKELFIGKTWAKKCDEIVKQLPKNVYISFDIDGLTPYLSPNTGTPVPGGFSLDELVFLFEKIIANGKTIIGFDLCEVSQEGTNEWDGNVGARALYKLCLLTLKSQRL